MASEAPAKQVRIVLAKVGLDGHDRGVKVVARSLHSGAHMTLFPAVIEELQKHDATDILVFGGGIIPDEDITELKRQGVAEIFTPGTPLQDIVDWLRRKFG